jgi:hypothetical protein
MTNHTLASSSLWKARSRSKRLGSFLEDGNFSDIIREAQEVVELALKGVLRQQGIEPPKWHDVSDILIAHSDRFSPDIRELIPRLADVSKRLRKERELSFYGDIDFIPTEEYDRSDADRAIVDARFVVETVSRVIKD